MAADLDAFVAHRLLTTEDDGGEIVVGVAHEAFLSAWPPLSEAISANVSALRMRRLAEQAAAEWDQVNRPPAKLWERGQLAAALAATGARVRRARRRLPSDTPSLRLSGRRRLPGWRPVQDRVLVTDKVELSPRARRFLHASIRRDRRRRARAISILSVLLILALASAGVASVQQRDADRQRRVAVQQQHAAEDQQRFGIARGLVAQADAVLGSDPRTALRLGIAAAHIHPGSETQSGLVNSLTATHYAATLPQPNSVSVGAVAFAPSGRTLATGNDDNTVGI